MNLKNFTHYWTGHDIPFRRSDISWYGHYYVITKNHNTGTVVYTLSKTFNAYYTPVYYGTFHAETTVPISTIMGGTPYQSLFNVDAGEYDLYIKIDYQLYGPGYTTSFHSSGSTTVQVTTDLAGSTYPVKVSTQQVENKLYPSSISNRWLYRSPNNSFTYLHM